jgi:hypothetical protein
VIDHDRELHEKLQRLESIEAYLAQHDKTVRRALMGIAAIGLILLVLVGYVINRL